MDDQQQTGHKDQLLELRNRLVREVKLAENAMLEDIVAPGEVSTIPTHPADQAAEGVDAEIAIAQNEEMLLVEVEAAIERIEAGTYGDCEQCGRPIVAARLQVLPYSRYCVECARKHPVKIDEPDRDEPRRL